jgi:hypothetical protein
MITLHDHGRAHPVQESRVHRVHPGPVLLDLYMKVPNQERGLVSERLSTHLHDLLVQLHANRDRHLLLDFVPLLLHPIVCPVHVDI